jgi:Uma2 family endonuclease
MGAKTLLSLEEFMALPDNGNRHELSQGELVVMPPPHSEHSIVLDNIKMILSDYVRGKRLGRVLPEAGYLLFREPEQTVRQPDVSFLSRGRVKKSAAYVEGAPELALEVVSPGDDAADLDLKVRQYLAAGSHEVWVVYPKTRSVLIHKAGGQVSKLSDSDTITTDLFPGWSARVADFFDLDY